jgi:hypothetical protein
MSEMSERVAGAPGVSGRRAVEAAARELEAVALDPAYELSRLLESDREGTVRALEALLTSDEAVGDATSELCAWLLPPEVDHREYKAAPYPLMATKVVLAACRSLLNVERRAGDPRPSNDKETQ